MIKGIPFGTGYLGYLDKLTVPIIENTPHEEDLRTDLVRAIEAYPETRAVLVRNHGVYVWGKSWVQAKTACECFDYLFSIAVEIRRLNL